MTARKAKNKKPKLGAVLLKAFTILFIYVINPIISIGIGVYVDWFLGVMFFLMAVFWMFMFAIQFAGGDPYPRMFVSGP